METDNLIVHQEESTVDSQVLQVNPETNQHAEAGQTGDHQCPSDTSTVHRKRDEKLHKRILIIAGVVYLIMFFALMAVFTFVQPLRVWYIDLIYQLKENSVQAYVTVFFVGVFCLLVGIPIFILEMIIGYIVKPLAYGVLLIIAFKMTGLSLTFLLGRYIFREKLKELIADNEYLDAFQDHADEEPLKIVFFLRVITIFPPILQDYGMGFIRVTYKQFFFPVLLSIIIFAIFYAYLGKSLKNMYEYYTNPDKNSSTNKELFFNIVFVILTILIATYFVREVQKRIEKAKDETLSSHSREEIHREDREIY